MERRKNNRSQGAQCPDQPNNLKAVIINRVSSAVQEDGFSLDAQNELNHNYCKQEGFTIVEVFTFQESAGGAKQRKIFDQIMQLIETKEIGNVVVEKTDRLLRNLTDYVKVKHLIQEHGIWFHMVKEREILHKNAGSHVKQVFGFKSLIAEGYLDNLAEESAKGMLQKAKSGVFPQRAPIGYLNNKQTKTIELDKNFAPVIKIIYKKYATGNYSLRELADWLNEHGYKPKDCKLFHKQTIARIVSNPFYYGFFRWRETNYRGTHQPIITEDLYLRCADVLIKNRNAKEKRKRKYPLSNLMWTENGRLFTGETAKGHTYYGAYIDDGKHRMYLRQDRIFAEIDKQMESIRWSEIFAAEVKKIAKEMILKERNFSSENVDAICRKIKTIEAKKARLVELWMDSGIDRSLYNQKTFDLQKEAQNCEKILSMHRNASDSFFGHIENITNIFLYLPTTYKNAKLIEKGRTLAGIIQKIIISEGKRIILVFKAPYAYFIKPAILVVNKTFTPEVVRERKVMLPLQDAFRTILAA